MIFNVHDGFLFLVLFACHTAKDENHLRESIVTVQKSAHTALAVKACLLGGNSNTKCSMTFVNIAVAISALAGGGGAKNDFAPRPKFRTETKIR